MSDGAPSSSSVELTVARSTMCRWGWLAWVLAACSSPTPIRDMRNAAGTMNAVDSGGAAGSGAAAGHAGNGDGSSRGGASGTSTIDAASDRATTGGSGGTADATTTDGDAGASRDRGQGGAGGATMNDGAADIGGATGGQSDAADGSPGTQPACGGLLAMIDRASWIAFDSDRDSLNRNLYMMHPDRSQLTQLTKGMNVDREPFFSYDGTRLSYTSVVAGKSQIFIMDLATRTSVQVTHRLEGADEPSFSRDGQWVAFHSGPSVYIIMTDGTGERLVAAGLDDANANRSPVFSADGSELVFNGHVTNAVKLDGTGIRSTGTGATPAISPSGVDIASSIGCDALGPFWTAAISMSPFATTTDQCRGRRITPVDDFMSVHPTWGTSIVLAYHRFDRATNRAVIAMISAVDSQPCILTSGPEDSRNPSWSQPSTL
ncbi:MAG TPA: hypothetical protein VK550_20290 [Polyangiaceae bacterium]|nr:hypothetical protein [Polyangiaceae bacterium]